MPNVSQIGAYKASSWWGALQATADYDGVRGYQVLLEGIMPTKMAELAEALGTTDLEGTLSEKAAWGQMVPGSKVSKVALFPRVDAPVKVAA